MTDIELAQDIGEKLREAEARMAAANVSPRIQKRFARLHAGMADIAHDLIDAGHVQPFSPIDKPPVP